MPTLLIPQEIFLLERYSSVEYYSEMRDAWSKMLRIAEQALQDFMLHLPPDYRSRHLSMQPDIVWGERVLPNFRSTLEALDQGYTMLAHGDFSAMGFAHNVESDWIGQSRDYPPFWMPENIQEEFYNWLHKAVDNASNIAITEQANWLIGNLSFRYREDSRGPLNPPTSWPIYRLNSKVTVTTDEPVMQSGVYLPACDKSCAALLIKNYAAREAMVGYDPSTGHHVDVINTTWTLVERIADEGGGDPYAEEIARFAAPPRVPAGEACTRSGWWFSPAAVGSVWQNATQYFEQGDIMPDMGRTERLTFWMWSHAGLLPQAQKEQDAQRRAHPAVATDEDCPFTGQWRDENNPHITVNVLEGAAMPEHQDQAVNWKWDRNLTAAEFIAAGGKPEGLPRASSDEACPRSGVWHVFNDPQHEVTLKKGEPMPKVQDQIVGWQWVRSY